MDVYADSKKANTYPLSENNDPGFGTVSAGRSVDSTAYFGVNGTDIELEWQPMFSISDKAIWKITP